MRANNRPVKTYTYRGAGQPDDPIWLGRKCGTFAGYQEHIRNKDPRCEACWRARNEYVREWRLRTGRVKSIRVVLTPAQLELLRRLAP